MNENTFKYPLPKGNWIPNFLKWADSIYPYFIWMDGNSYPYNEGAFERKFLAGHEVLSTSEIWSNPEIKKAGIISYEYKNRLEDLESNNRAILDLPELLFFKADLEIKA
ncbi:hypothetical protein [Algoriphagus sp. CAU 1675]|uniref:hypothetical protein n=1 Tax=Algoriphagus sp. CAU 1675 TaxID=3032597 RepID=UPI0023DCB4F6|nr:hypothetical protein [Algoriphagus sp. CAU 1675]MDF2158530.1 hypothetical protein [Algoriphagus sp. CAU 1675]